PGRNSEGGDGLALARGRGDSMGYWGRAGPINRRGPDQSNPVEEGHVMASGIVAPAACPSPPVRARTASTPARGASEAAGLDRAAAARSGRGTQGEDRWTS